MLKRKSSVSSKATRSRKSPSAPKTEAKPAPVRRRFIISSKARNVPANTPETNGKGKHPIVAKSAAKSAPNGQAEAPVSSPVQSTVDLTETIKTLVHLGQEHGYVTYDDINDVLPDNLSPDDLDVLLTKLRSPRCGNRDGSG